MTYSGPVLISDKLMKCSACRAYSYCSRKCQQLDWKQAHKYKECSLYKVLAARPADYFNYDEAFNYTLVVRYLLKLKYDANARNITVKLFDGRHRKITDLVNHVNDLVANCPHEVNFVRDLITKLNQLPEVQLCFDEKFALEKYSELFTNTMSIIDESSVSNESIGWCIKLTTQLAIQFPNRSGVVSRRLMLRPQVTNTGRCTSNVYCTRRVVRNCSCRPTLNRIFDGIKIQFRALTTINTQTTAPTICYIDAINDRSTRRSILKKASLAIN